ncbi:translation elongation factor Ts [Desulfurispirillum indicum]|uniref:Elongation factor Ts n=1 Tax=Desulfurispirillum indicum (strain ATCC BAA-1389 / DSM 22839 / S5) TaxID=653733 RepID=E6W168_DESIS|nr:translation elongation factor Ts [Desulfurispirillum indicum]ADU66488.1 translation elongation factor Ts [Desulfurispirillum indicum S5]UCZ55824.1 translation elongation factor Ts [Desulfurispirillum indicum]
MTAITASMVKELREKTGAGMMDCKKALGETNGDLEAAVDYLRTKGLAAAAKKAGRVAAEGMVADYVGNGVGVIAEINSETDFVAKNEEFQQFTTDIARIIASENPADVDDLLQKPFGDGNTVAETLTQKIAKIGENMSIRRFNRMQGQNVATYIHMGGKIGVIVNLNGGDGELAKDLCLHIAASNPQFLDQSSVDPEFIAREEAVFTAKAQEEGKPEKIIANIVKGQVSKRLKDVCLLNQPFVKNPDLSIEQLLKEKGASIVAFSRFQLGEGIEKKECNFAEEVQQQVQGLR